MEISIEVKSRVYGGDILAAVRELSKNFRVGKDLPSIQLFEIEKAQVALRKMHLQVKWWFKTREGQVRHDAFEFVAEAADRDGFIPDEKICCAHEIESVKDLVRVGVLVRVNKKDKKGYQEAEGP